jgi:polyhydroxyalkanoate synthesis regulator phasin
VKLFEVFAAVGLDTAAFDKGIETSAQKGQTLQGKLEGVFKGIKTAITVAGIGIAVKQIGDALETAASVGDTIDESSQKLGLSRKAYQEWGYVLKQNGGNIESFGVGMKTLQTAMAQGTAQTDAALAKLGLSAAQLKTLSPEDALTETIKAFQQMPAGAEKSALAVDLFGKQGMELLPILNQSSEATAGLIQQANDLGIILNDETIDAGADFSDTLATMKDTITAAGTAFLSKLMPGITKTMDKLIPFFSNVLPKLGEAFGKVLEKVAPLVETLVGGFTTAVTWIADNAETLIPILEGVAGAILLWNGYQAILNITMAANPITAVITAVAYLAAGIALLTSAFSGTNEGMDRFNAVADDIANNTTDFSDLVAKMTPNILNVNDLISSTGKTVGELESTIKEKEDAITAILKSAMEDHRALRQDELDDIAQYNTDIASLNDELIQQYRDVELAKLRQIQLEAGDMTVAQMAQYEADMKAALESANKTSEDAYVARLAMIENTHRAIGDIGSAAYLKEQQDAKANYEARLAENQSYYDQAQRVFLESAAVLVGAEKKKNSDLNLEYQTGLDNLNKHYDNWEKYTTDFYENVNHMGSEEAQRELAASQKLYDDQLAVINSAMQPELDAIQTTFEKKYTSAQSYFTAMGGMESDHAKKVFAALMEDRDKSLAEVHAKYDPQIKIIEDAHTAQYNETYNHYGRVNELGSAEAQAALAAIEKERAEQTAAWIALYADKNAAAEAGATSQMQITQDAFNDLASAQQKFSDDIAEIEGAAYANSNLLSQNALAGVLISNSQKTEANDKYAAAYADFFENLDEDAWKSFLYQYDVAKQSGQDIPAEYTTMLAALLDTFANMPADMQGKGKEMLQELLSGVKNPDLRARLTSASKGSASDMVSAIRTELGLGSGGGGGGNPYNSVSSGSQGYRIGSNLIQALAAGMENERRNAGSKATSIGSWIIQAFKNVFGIHSRSKVMYDEVGENVMLGITDRIADGKKTVANLLNGILPDSLSSSLSLGVTRDYLGGERARTSTEAGGGGSPKVVNVQYTNNVYANDTSYAEQQRIAQKSVRKLQEALYGY